MNLEEANLYMVKYNTDEMVWYMRLNSGGY
jgi:hypothetical protein